MDPEYTKKRIAEKMLEDFLLEDVLEMNDLTEEDALYWLITSGQINVDFYEVVVEDEELQSY